MLLVLVGLQVSADTRTPFEIVDQLPVRIALHAKADEAGVKIRWAIDGRWDIGAYVILRKDVGMRRFRVLDYSLLPVYLDTDTETENHQYRVGVLDRIGRQIAVSDAFDVTAKTQITRICRIPYPLAIQTEHAGKNLKLRWQLDLHPELAAYRLYLQTAGSQVYKPIKDTIFSFTQLNIPETRGDFRIQVRGIDTHGREGLASDSVSGFSAGSDRRDWNWQLSMLPSDGAVYLNWQMPDWDDLAAVFVFRRKQSDAAFEKLAACILPEFWDRSLTNNNTYEYYLQAVSVFGEKLAVSEVKTAVPEGLPWIFNAQAEKCLEDMLVRWVREPAPKPDPAMPAFFNP